MNTLVEIASCLILYGGLNAAEMAERLSARLDALDHLRIEVESTEYWAPAEGSISDVGAWYNQSPTYSHEILIARPTWRHHWISDARDTGYTQVATSYSEQTAVALYDDRRCDSGRRVFHVFESCLERAPYAGWLPMSQAFELVSGWIGEAGFSLSSLLGDGTLQLTEADERACSYVGVATRGRVTVRFSVSMSYDAVPLHIVAEIERTDVPLVTIIEQETLQTMEVNGVAMPIESVISVAIPGLPSVDAHRDVHHIAVTRVEVDPALDIAGVAIVPDTADAIISTFSSEGRRLVEFDENGAMIRDVYHAMSSNVPAKVVATAPTDPPYGQIAAFAGFALSAVTALTLVRMARTRP